MINNKLQIIKLNNLEVTIKSFKLFVHASVYLFLVHTATVHTLQSTKLKRRKIKEFLKSKILKEFKYNNIFICRTEK